MAPLPGIIGRASSVVPMAAAATKKKADPVYIATVTDPPVNTVPPVVSGYVYNATQLSCTTGTWDNSPTGYTYQWKRDGADIGGATSSTYTCVEADETKTLSCVVTASNAFGSASQASNNLTSWMPSSLTLRLWLDANVPSKINTGTPSDGDAVSPWVDRSPNAVSYTQATGAKKPTYKTGILNGRSVIRFTNAGKQNLAETTINTVDRSAAHTVFAVIKETSFIQAYHYFAVLKASASNPALAISSNASYKDFFCGDDTSASPWKVQRYTTITNPTGKYHLIIWTYNGSGANTIGNFGARCDGAALTQTATTGQDGATKNIIGSYKDSVIYNWDGDIAEFGVVASDLTGTGDLTNLETYINQKWGTMPV